MMDCIPQPGSSARERSKLCSSSIFSSNPWRSVKEAESMIEPSAGIAGCQIEPVTRLTLPLRIMDRRSLNVTNAPRQKAVESEITIASRRSFVEK
jgi:hypothetical protein